MKRLLAFAIAGGLGFVVDAAVLALLLRLTVLGPFAARIISIAVAMAATWIINRTFTFGPSGRSLAAEGSRYGAVGLAAALFNYVVYSALLLIVPGLSPFLALLAASASAMTASYLGYSRLVFAPRHKS